jgi:hypothetical protein
MGQTLDPISPWGITMAIRSSNERKKNGAHDRGARFRARFALAALLTAAVAAAGIARETRTVDIPRSMKALAKAHPSAGAQKKLLEDSRQAVATELAWFGPTAAPHDVFYASLTSFAAGLAKPHPLVANRFGEVHFAGAIDDGPLDPRIVRYEFGSRGLRKLKDGAPQKGKAGLVTSLDGKAIPAIDGLAWFTEGMLPETELVLAAIERELDVDRGGDSLFAFLEVWRNADESFYEALDRTAGSPDGLFQYDMMLDGFAQEFLTKEDRKAKDFLARGRDAAHDRFHESFLTVRKYRSLVEAAAYSLVLPPDISLPDRMARHDFSAVSGTALSVRDEVLLILADADGDVMKAVAFLGDVLRTHHLPAKLHSTADYDPVTALSGAVLERISAGQVATRSWVAQWTGDPKSLSTLRAVADAYRALRLAHANDIRAVVKAVSASS